MERGTSTKKHSGADDKNRCKMGSDAMCQLFCSLLLKVQKCPHSHCVSVFKNGEGCEIIKV